MYFKTKLLCFSICHAVEWNFGAGFVSDTPNANTLLNSSLVSVSSTRTYRAPCTLRTPRSLPTPAARALPSCVPRGPRPASLSCCHVRLCVLPGSVRRAPGLQPPVRRGGHTACPPRPQADPALSPPHPIMTNEAAWSSCTVTLS